MKNNVGWLILGVLSGLLWWSAGYNWVQSERYDRLLLEIETQKFDQDVCIQRVQELTSREREPKKLAH